VSPARASDRSALAPPADEGPWGLAGAVDRAAALRGDVAAVRALLSDPRARVLLVGDQGVATDDDASLAWVTVPGTTRLPDPPDVPAAPAHADGPTAAGPAHADDTAEPLDAWVLLALADDGAPLLARRTSADSPVRGRWTALRPAFGTLDDTELVLAATAVALHAWHSRHPRCPRCGAPTRPAQAGWSRVCTAEGSEHYPRTDPAVIMAVVDDADRLLLGHAASWPQGRFSTLAGFVEPGESLEQAVRREVEEEVGVRVEAVEYVGSQPWPFPASLMVGFRARARSAPATPDGQEVTEAVWVTRDELAERVAAGVIGLPGRASIARRLIEGWFGGRIDEPAHAPGWGTGGR